MLITIIADASWDRETGACGWSSWLASERGKKGAQGHEPEPVLNVPLAEMIAVHRGVEAGLANSLVQLGDHLLLQTDCQAAIHAFEGRRTSITQAELEAVENFDTLLAAHALTCTFRWVKGHTNGGTPRTFINNKCDEFAKAEMRKARAVLRQVAKEQA